jgi:dienelactone hydrolase
MTSVLLFHHAQGLTDGVLAFAERLRDAGHVVTVPDLYRGKTFATVEEGVAYAEQVGFEKIVAACAEAAEELPERMVYAGMSLGVMPAQRLAQSRAGALGLLALHAAVPLDAFGDSAWPAGVDVQIHLNEGDEFDDREVARDFVERVSGRAELFLYPGSTHLFSDNSLEDYEEESAELLLGRVLAFLGARE